MITAIQGFSPAKTYTAAKNSSSNRVNQTKANTESSINFGCAPTPTMAGCVDHMIKPVDLAYRKAVMALGKNEIVQEVVSHLGYFPKGQNVLKKSFNQYFLNQSFDFAAYIDRKDGGERLFVMTQKGAFGEITKEFANSVEGIISAKPLYERVMQIEKLSNGNKIETFVANDYPSKSVALILPDRKITAVIDGMTTLQDDGIYWVRDFNSFSKSKFDDNLIQNNISPAFLEMLGQCRRGEKVKPVSLEELKNTTTDPNISYLLN